MLTTTPTIPPASPPASITVPSAVCFAIVSANNAVAIPLPFSERSSANSASSNSPSKYPFTDLPTSIVALTIRPNASAFLISSSLVLTFSPVFSNAVLDVCFAI